MSDDEELQKLRNAALRSKKRFVKDKGFENYSDIFYRPPLQERLKPNELLLQTSYSGSLASNSSDHLSSQVSLSAFTHDDWRSGLIESIKRSKPRNNTPMPNTSISQQLSSFQQKSFSIHQPPSLQLPLITTQLPSLPNHQLHLPTIPIPSTQHYVPTCKQHFINLESRTNIQNCILASPLQSDVQQISQSVPHTKFQPISQQLPQQKPQPFPHQIPQQLLQHSSQHSFILQSHIIPVLKHFPPTQHPSFLAHHPTHLLPYRPPLFNMPTFKDHYSLHKHPSAKAHSSTYKQPANKNRSNLIVVSVNNQPYNAATQATSNALATPCIAMTTASSSSHSTAVFSRPQDKWLRKTKKIEDKSSSKNKKSKFDRYDDSGGSDGDESDSETDDNSNNYHTSGTKYKDILPSIMKIGDKALYTCNNKEKYNSGNDVQNKAILGIKESGNVDDRAEDKVIVSEEGSKMEICMETSTVATERREERGGWEKCMEGANQIVAFNAASNNKHLIDASHYNINVSTQGIEDDNYISPCTSDEEEVIRGHTEKSSNQTNLSALCDPAVATTVNDNTINSSNVGCVTVNDMEVHNQASCESDKHLDTAAPSSSVHQRSSSVSSSKQSSSLSSSKQSSSLSSSNKIKQFHGSPISCSLNDPRETLNVMELKKDLKESNKEHGGALKDESNTYVGGSDFRRRQDDRVLEGCKETRRPGKRLQGAGMEDGVIAESRFKQDVIRHGEDGEGRIKGHVSLRREKGFGYNYSDPYLNRVSNRLSGNRYHMKEDNGDDRPYHPHRYLHKDSSRRELKGGCHKAIKVVRKGRQGGSEEKVFDVDERDVGNVLDAKSFKEVGRRQRYEGVESAEEYGVEGGKCQEEAGYNIGSLGNSGRNFYIREGCSMELGQSKDYARNVCTERDSNKNIMFNKDRDVHEEINKVRSKERSTVKDSIKERELGRERDHDEGQFHRREHKKGSEGAEQKAERVCEERAMGVVNILTHEASSHEDHKSEMKYAMNQQTPSSSIKHQPMPFAPDDNKMVKMRGVDVMRGVDGRRRMDRRRAIDRRKGLDMRRKVNGIKPFNVNIEVDAKRERAGSRCMNSRREGDVKKGYEEEGKHTRSQVDACKSRSRSSSKYMCGSIRGDRKCRNEHIENVHRGETIDNNTRRSREGYIMERSCDKKGRYKSFGKFESLSFNANKMNGEDSIFKDDNEKYRAQARKQKNESNLIASSSTNTSISNVINDTTPSLNDKSNNSQQNDASNYSELKNGNNSVKRGDNDDIYKNVKYDNDKEYDDKEYESEFHEEGSLQSNRRVIQRYNKEDVKNENSYSNEYYNGGSKVSMIVVEAEKRASNKASSSNKNYGSIHERLGTKKNNTRRNSRNKRSDLRSRIHSRTKL